MSYDRILTGGAGQARGTGGIGWKVGVVHPIFLNEFEMTLDVVLIAKEQQTAIHLGAGRIVGIWDLAATISTAHVGSGKASYFPAQK